MSELTGYAEKLKDSLRTLSGMADPEITLSLHTGGDSSGQYFKDLQTSIDQMHKGEYVSFTMEELEAYMHKLTE